jgi:hypothetical protein
VGEGDWVVEHRAVVETDSVEGGLAWGGAAAEAGLVGEGVAAVEGD